MVTMDGRTDVESRVEFTVKEREADRSCDLLRRMIGSRVDDFWGPKKKETVEKLENLEKLEPEAVEE